MMQIIGYTELLPPYWVTEFSYLLNEYCEYVPEYTREVIEIRTGYHAGLRMFTRWVILDIQPDDDYKQKLEGL